MFRVFLCILSVFLALPAVCGEFEEATKTYNKIFLYLYTKDCSYCVKFNPVYNIISQKYANNCKFLKINADTEYGGSLMRGLGAFYVPYVALIDNPKRIVSTINPTRLLNKACTYDAMEKFIK